VPLKEKNEETNYHDFKEPKFDQVTDLKVQRIDLTGSEKGEGIARKGQDNNVKNFRHLLLLYICCPFLGQQPSKRDVTRRTNCGKGGTRRRRKSSGRRGVR